MMVVFSSGQGLAEDSGGWLGSRLVGTTRSGRRARRGDCVNYVLIPSAPAEIALEPGADAFFARLRVTVQQLQ